MAAMSYAQAVFDMVQMGLREGSNPQILIATTPRPLPIIRRLVKDETVTVVKGSTFDNAANLSPIFIDEIKRQYEGTRLGRQELFAEILDDNPGALFQRKDIEDCRVKDKTPKQILAQCDDIVVAVDPSMKGKATSDECGLIVAGRINDCYYVLEDCSSVMSPATWASRVVNIYHKWSANKVVIETNQGGDLNELVIKTIDPTIPIKQVAARQSKTVRAEPVSSLVEQHRVFFVGNFPKLEDELANYDKTLNMPSPNRYDAFVYAILYLSQHERSWAFNPEAWKVLRSA